MSQFHLEEVLSGGSILHNYNYLIYNVVGQELLQLAADAYMIDGVVGIQCLDKNMRLKLILKMFLILK